MSKCSKTQVQRRHEHAIDSPNCHSGSGACQRPQRPHDCASIRPGYGHGKATRRNRHLWGNVRTHDSTVWCNDEYRVPQRPNNGRSQRNHENRRNIPRRHAERGSRSTFRGRLSCDSRDYASGYDLRVVTKYPLQRCRGYVHTIAT